MKPRELEADFFADAAGAHRPRPRRPRAADPTRWEANRGLAWLLKSVMDGASETLLHEHLLRSEGLAAAVAVAAADLIVDSVGAEDRAQFRAGLVAALLEPKGEEPDPKQPGDE